ncbi:P2X purinoceptor 7-like [Rhopilema esculentum]|uniref:P2X purinoceptor 7-like n=1 Tax=Rhopilema esculentum TaxID=499914 RepID=UPI0031CE7930|eukprot:gene5705-10955_t
MAEKFIDEVLSSEESTDGNCESEDNAVPEINRLKPFDMEPRRKLEDWELNDLDGKSDDSTESESERERIGNAYWCVCGGKCKAMETYAESLCCQETNDIPENYFQGQSWISLSADFKIVCLTRAVLETALSAMNNLRGDKLVINNRTLRFAAYKQYTWWVHNRLGKGVRKVIPSCAIWAIRNSFPSENAYYVPFMESRLEDKRLYQESDSDE